MVVATDLENPEVIVDDQAEVTDDREKKPRKPRISYNIDDERFIVAYKTSNSEKEVAEKLGVPANFVSARARVLIKAGAKLKEFPKQQRLRRDEMHVKKLNDLIDTLDKK